MDIHYSETYYWKTMVGKKIEFSEFDYPDLQSAVAAIDSSNLWRLVLSRYHYL